MAIWGFLPARIGSTRLPNKPLQKVLNKPLIQWVIERCLSLPLDHLVLTSDDERVLEIGKNFGLITVKTRSELPSGTDRIFEAASKLGVGDSDWVLNLQADEPCVTSQVIESLKEGLLNSYLMTTVATKLDNCEMVLNPNVVKVLINKRSEAVYFSRFPIPFSRDNCVAHELPFMGVYRHLGFYGYQMHFLRQFCQWNVGFWERFESLEQLRALERAVPIFVAVIPFEGISIDTLEDLRKFEESLISKGYL